MAASGVTGLLVECRDEPGVLHRITEVILRHGANISYVAGGAREGPIAEIQLEVSGAVDQGRLIADVEAVPGVTRVTAVPTFQAIYGKRVIVIGGGAQVGMVAQGAISEADRHNIRGERISVDTIPLVGEEQLADAVRAVARLQTESCGEYGSPQACDCTVGVNVLSLTVLRTPVLSTNQTVSASATTASAANTSAIGRDGTVQKLSRISTLFLSSFSG